MAILDSTMLVSQQGVNRGGEDHTAMMERMIEMEQEQGNFAFIPKDR